jgi:hypothetical protein
LAAAGRRRGVKRRRDIAAQRVIRRWACPDEFVMWKNSCHGPVKPSKTGENCAQFTTIRECYRLKKIKLMFYAALRLYRATYHPSPWEAL